MPVQTVARTPIGVPAVSFIQSAPLAPARRPRAAYWFRQESSIQIPVPVVSTTVQNVWPPRVTVSVTGILGSDTISLYRIVNGTQTLLRGADNVSITGTDAFVRTDAELPYGVDVKYRAVLNGGQYSGMSPGAPTYTWTPTGATATEVGGGTLNYLTTLDGDATDIPNGATVMLVTSGGTLKQAGTFTVTSKASAFGYTNINVSPAFAAVPAVGDKLQIATQVAGPPYTSLTVTLPGGTVAFSDAISGLSASARIMAWPDKTRTRESSIFTVGGRNIAVTGARSQFSSTLDLYTDTTAAANNLSTLLDGATNGVIQVRANYTDLYVAGKVYDDVDCYVTVLSDTKHRWSSDGSDERRTWTLDVVEVDAWPASLDPADFTLANIAADYTTLADLAAAYPSLLALAQGSF